ncbi:MAG TPA: response regulator transcription factor [Microlunatus sp.]
MRIVIGEDESLLRQGMTHLLERAGHQVVGTAADADELIRHVDERRPDVVVTDIRMPPDFTDEGLRAALRIRGTHPTIGIMLLSQHVQRRYAVELIASNPNGVGYLLKQRIADVSTFCADLVRVADGGTVLDPEVVALMITRADRDHPPGRRLTPRQQQVLALMAEGRSNAAIAACLSITEKAVVQHVSHIYDHLMLPPNTDDHRRVLAVLHHLSR